MVIKGVFQTICKNKASEMKAGPLEHNWGFVRFCDRSGESITESYVLMTLDRVEIEIPILHQIALLITSDNSISKNNCLSCFWC